MLRAPPGLLREDRGDPGGMDTHPARGPAALSSTSCRCAGFDIDIALLLDLDLLLADVAGDALGVLDDALADLDLLGHDRTLGDVDPLLADRDADLLALADGVGGDPFGRGPAVDRGPLDHDFLALDGDLERLLLGVDLLADADLAGLDGALLGMELLFLDLDGIALAGGRSTGGAAGRARPRRGAAGGRGAGDGLVIAGDLRAGGHIVGVISAQDGPRLVGPAFGLDGNDRPARFQLALIVVGLILRDAGAGQGADQPADAGPGRDIAEDDAQGPGGDRRADHGDDPGEHPEARERTESQAGHGPGHGAGLGSRSGGIRDVLALEALVVVPHGDADLVVPEPGPAEFIDGPVGLLAILEDSNDRQLLSSHEFLLAECGSHLRSIPDRDR